MLRESGPYFGCEVLDGSHCVERKFQVKYPDHGQDGNDPDDRITTKIYVGRVYAEIEEGDLYKLFDEEAKKISPLAKVLFLVLITVLKMEVQNLIKLAVALSRPTISKSA